jgi:hypothetical protein
MEWESVEEMQEMVRQTVEGGYRLCYASCCSKLQIIERDNLATIHHKLEKYRDEGISAQKETQANAAFVNLCFVDAIIGYLQLWLLIKEDRMDEAWGQLVEAQELLQCALRFVSNKTFQNCLRELVTLEHLLFPPQQFLSSSHYFSCAICTICNSEYGECDHVAGRLYMGQECVRQIHEITGADHIAFVENPRDKRCRWTKVRKNGFMYCTLTFRQLEKADPNRGDAEACILTAST